MRIRMAAAAVGLGPIAVSLALAQVPKTPVADPPPGAPPKDAVQRGAQFLSTLQYTESSTQHFASDYRAKYLVGGFHVMHSDGDLRLDDSRHAVAALVQFLATVPDA